MGLTEMIAHYATAFIDKTGYISVFFLMILESMVFPIPSEAVMPFAGFLIETGKFTFPLVILFSTLGSIIGSLLSYALGKYGGKPIVDKWGKYLLLDHEELVATEKFFQKYGDITIFISRFIPVVRHLISIPAGMAGMNIWKFSLFTVIGAGMWNAFLAYCGLYLQQNWTQIMKYSHVVDLVVAGILILLIAFYVYRHLRKKK